MTDDAPHGGVHRYSTVCTWAGSTGAGYDGYDRRHQVTAPPVEAGLAMSGDPAFGGDASRFNPEQLLVAAASSCQMLSFLAVAARARIDVIAYRDEATGEMPDGAEPMWVERITLRPRITVAAGTNLRRLDRLVELAHRECFIASSLRTSITVEPVYAEASDYAFRDGDAAAARLAMVARLFDPSSRAFVARALSASAAPVRLAVDLGCGPGNTTALLAEVSGAARTVGLDESEHFLAEARSARARRSASFATTSGRRRGRSSPATAARPTSPTAASSWPTCPSRPSPRSPGSASLPRAACCCSTSSSGSAPTSPRSPGTSSS